MPIAFVTGNEGKAREAAAHLPASVTVTAVDYDYTEIQHPELATIARHGVRDAHAALEYDEVLVGDAGLFVDGLGGFPGPYSAYVEDTVGIEGIWRLARELEDRTARFETVLAYTDGTVTETFAGTVEGTIVAPRGEGGFGYDPIFAHDGTTMAEMTTDEKNAVSHRGRALEAFAAWYTAQ